MDKRPCTMCPCKPTVPELHRDLLRQFMDIIKASGGFPCHDKHPKANVLTEEAIGADGKYHTLDCVGYAIWGLTEKPNA